VRVLYPLAKRAVAVVLTGSGLLVAGCPPPTPSTVEWQSAPTCDGCDGALKLAVENMRVRNARLLEGLGIVDAAPTEPYLDDSKAQPHLVCPQGDGWMVVFVMPKRAIFGRRVCVGVLAMPDGGTVDEHKDLLCDWWENQSNCSGVTWTRR
jgi:hypothetical protein